MTPKLLLASISPRRKVLLESMGLVFDVIPSKFEEHLDNARSPQEVALELGFGKVDAVAKDNPEAYVVGGDAIVVIDGQQLEKPVDEADAKDMLHRLSGQTHQVVTSVIVVCINDDVREGVVSTVDVTFKQLSEELINNYVATGDPYDKAGGYAREHPLLKPYITTHGDLHAVNGLSTIELRKLLEKHGILVPNDQSKTEYLFENARPTDPNYLM